MQPEHGPSSGEDALEQAVRLVREFEWVYDQHVYDQPRHAAELTQRLPRAWRAWMEEQLCDWRQAREQLASLLHREFGREGQGARESPLDLPSDPPSAGLPPDLVAFTRRCVRLARPAAFGVLEREVLWDGVGPEGHPLHSPAATGITAAPLPTLQPHTHRCQMSVKKFHEVQWLEHLALRVARAEGVDLIVDLGAGTGYLSSTLARAYPVHAIDGDAARTCGSQRRWDPHGSNPNITQHTLLLDSGSLCAFLAELTATPAGRGRRILLVCLHACGDLSAKIMLDGYLSCPQVRAMVSVGCCYNRLVAFPLSRRVREGCGLGALNIRARSSASHALPPTVAQVCGRWVRFYQSAMLDLLLNEGRGSGEDAGARQHGSAVGKRTFPTFPAFAQAAQPSLSPESLLPRARAVEARWGGVHVEALLTLLAFAKAALGPVVEGVLLQDRLWSLRERLPGGSGSVPFLVRLFDPALSPRCTALVSRKGERAG
jgi:hypothetical protein